MVSVVQGSCQCGNFLLLPPGSRSAWCWKDLPLFLCPLLGVQSTQPCIGTAEGGLSCRLHAEDICSHRISGTTVGLLSHNYMIEWGRNLWKGQLFTFQQHLSRSVKLQDALLILTMWVVLKNSCVGDRFKSELKGNQPLFIHWKTAEPLLCWGDVEVVASHWASHV